jgi:selenoprotein W-related protein
LTEALLERYKRQIRSFELIPSDGGRFEVSVDGKLVFSKLEEGRFPEASEIQKLLEARRK